MAEVRKFDFSLGREQFDRQVRAVNLLGTRAVEHARTIEALAIIIARELAHISQLDEEGRQKADEMKATVRSDIEALRPELEGNSFSVSGRLYGWTGAEETQHLNPNAVVVTNTPATITQVLNPQQHVDGGTMEYISHRLYWGSIDLPQRSLRLGREFKDQPRAKELGAYFNPTSLYVDVDPVVILKLNDDARQKVGLVVGEDLNHEYGYHSDLVFARLQEVELTPLAVERKATAAYSWQSGQ